MSKRFVVKFKQTVLFVGSIKILVDTETGVNYIISSGYGPGAMTPLLDKDGNVVIDPV